MHFLLQGLQVRFFAPDEADLVRETLSLTPSHAQCLQQGVHFSLQGLQVRLFPPDALGSLPHLPQHGGVSLLQGVGLGEQAVCGHLAQQ